ncbi:hypothetical protein TNCT_738791 [Trichonephila clavata]|uniref:Uncharacterized protein n=1 Tax=Trichonephila clavata TaxID=2740835 RepID=A0A8X6FNW4_TRICU|nr:hypothetical protein TNCT_738791 [Trichonephila clavata]
MMLLVLEEIRYRYFAAFVWPGSFRQIFCSGKRKKFLNLKSGQYASSLKLEAVKLIFREAKVKLNGSVKLKQSNHDEAKAAASHTT